MRGLNVRSDFRYWAGWWCPYGSQCLWISFRNRLRRGVWRVCRSCIYIATAADLSAARRLAYFLVSYIAGILCSGLVGSKLAQVTGYSDKPLDAIGAVIVSALAVKILTFLNNQDVRSLVALITRRGGSGGTQ